VDLWPITIGARRSLLSTFEELDAATWEVGSLCGGWTDGVPLVEAWLR
jgi:hypothetical protein